MSQKACCCSCSTKKTASTNKDTIVITIETCDKRATPEITTSTSKCPSLVSCKPSCPALKRVSKSNQAIACSQQGTETERRLFTLPILSPRHHGPGCAMEISIIEKHDQNCQFRKEDNPNRNPADDRVGSYECIGRMVFRTCADAAANSSFPPCAPPPCGNPPPCGPSAPCAPTPPCGPSPPCVARPYSKSQHASNSKRNKCVPGCTARCSTGSQAVFRLLAQSILEPSFKWDQDLSKFAFLTQPQPMDSTSFQKDRCECSDPMAFLDMDREKLIHLENAIKLRQEIEMLVTSLRTFATTTHTTNKPVNVANQVPSHITTSVGASFPTLSNCRSFGNFKCKGSMQTSQETIISLGLSNDLKCEKLSKNASISSLARLKAFFKRSKNNKSKKETKSVMVDATDGDGDKRDDDKIGNDKSHVENRNRPIPYEKEKNSPVTKKKKDKNF